MSNYFKVLGKPINPLYINDREMDIRNKKVEISQVSSTTWENAQNGELHAFGGSSTIYNDKIHIFGINDNNIANHYSFDGTTLSIVDSNIFPHNLTGCSVITFRDKIHIFGGSTTQNKKTRNTHFTWDEENGYTLIGTVPYYVNNATAIIVNDEIHLLGGDHSSSSKKAHYIYDGESWRKGIALKQALVGKHRAYITRGTDPVDSLEYGKDILHVIYYNSKKRKTLRYFLRTSYDKKSKIVQKWEADTELYSDLNVGLVCDINDMVHALSNRDHYMAPFNGVYGPDGFRKGLDVLPYPIISTADDNANLLSYKNDLYLVYNDETYYPIWVKTQSYTLKITDEE